MRILDLEHPWMRIAGLGLSCFAGVSTSALIFLAVHLGQQRVWPSADVRTIELLAEPGSAPWVESWALVLFWVVLGFAALFAGYMVGAALYEWLAKRYGFLRLKEGA